MPIRFLAHPDARVLGGWLRRDIEARRARDPLAPVLVLAPNRRLARALRRRLTEGGGAYLALRVVDLWALASQLCALAPDTEAPLRLAPEPLLREAVEGCLRQPGDRLDRLAPGSPGLARSLLATFEELREAEVSEADVAALLGSESGGDPAAETLRVYARYLAALGDLEGRGWADRAGFVRRASTRAGAWAERVAAVYLYGAYELIGVHASLLRSISEAAEATCLLPVAHAHPAWAYGVEFARAFLLRPGETIEFLGEPDVSRGVRAARALYDEEVAAPPIDPPAFELFHAQGIEAELSAVARRILDLHLRGTPLRRVGVVARALGPYAPYLERVFESHGIPFSTSANQPLSRFPVTAALRSLLRVLAHDFERADLLDLLRSPLLRCPEGISPRPDLLERWSGEASLRGGLAAWTEDLPDWVRSRAEEIAGRGFEDAQEGESFRLEQERALASQMETLRLLGREAGAWRERAGWAEHADFMVGLARRWLRGFETGEPTDPAAREVCRQLEELRAAGSARGRREGPAGPAAALEALEGALAGRQMPIRDEDRDGVQVLDGMQARGHVFDVLFVMGFNAGSFPLRLGEDPFLPESWRRRLREIACRPVPLRQNAAEERLLLALWTASAGERLVVSYLRADEGGRAETPSFALREVARVVLGKPDPQALGDLAQPVPVHPGQRILHWGENPGLVAPAEEAILVALGAGNRAAQVRTHLSARGGLDERLDAALAWMEERGGGWSRAEGRSGPPPLSMLPRAWSPSRLEELARCPLQFFFSRVVRLEPVPEPPETGMFDPLDWGLRVHALLQDVFRTLGREGLLEPGGGPLREEEAARCRELARGAWEEHFGDLGRRVSRRLPLLWEEQARRWRDCLESFVAREARAWRERELRLVEIEGEGEARLAAGAGSAEPPLVVRGKLDRVAAQPGGGVLISDYKVSRRLDSLGDGKEVLRGLRLQAPLYAWMEEARAGSGPPPRVDVEFIGVGPEHDENPEGASVLLADADLKRWRQGVEETVRTLAGLAAAGTFPFHHDERRCARCDFEAACHHGDRDARSAVEADPEHADYFDTQRKVLKATTLAEVRAVERKR